MSVRDALDAFGTELRIQLLNYYWRHPRTNQADAARELGATLSAVGLTVRHLVQLEVLTAEPDAEDGRARVYTVNDKRVNQLRTALNQYLQPPQR